MSKGGGELLKGEEVLGWSWAWERRGKLFPLLHCLLFIHLHHWITRWKFMYVATKINEVQFYELRLFCLLWKGPHGCTGPAVQGLSLTTAWAGGCWFKLWAGAGGCCLPAPASALGWLLPSHCLANHCPPCVCVTGRPGGTAKWQLAVWEQENKQSQHQGEKSPTMSIMLLPLRMAGCRWFVIMSPASTAQGAGSCQSAFTKLCWKDKRDTHPGEWIYICRLSLKQF